jgi:hypothetical protein
MTDGTVHSLQIDAQTGKTTQSKADVEKDETEKEAGDTD